MTDESSGALLRQVIVDMADMKAMDYSSGQMTTSTLGSCLAVAIFDPVAHVAGLLRFMLPDSSIDRERALQNPFLFADTGIPLLFRRAYNLGAVKERIICKLAGASNVIDPSHFLEIGVLNHLAACQILSKNNVQVSGECVGGIAGMDLAMDMETGRIMVSQPYGGTVEL